MPKKGFQKEKIMVVNGPEKGLVMALLPFIGADFEGSLHRHFYSVLRRVCFKVWDNYYISKQAPRKKAITMGTNLELKEATRLLNFSKTFYKRLCEKNARKEEAYRNKIERLQANVDRIKAESK